MKICEYCSSRSLLDLSPRSFTFENENWLFSEMIWPNFILCLAQISGERFTGPLVLWFDHVTCIMLIKFHFHVLKSLKRIFLLKIDKSFWGSYFIVLKLLFICMESWAKSGEDIDLGQLYTCIYSKLSASTNFLVTVYKSFWGILYLLFTTEKPKLLKMILPKNRSRSI